MLPRLIPKVFEEVVIIIVVSVSRVLQLQYICASCECSKHTLIHRDQEGQVFGDDKILVRCSHEISAFMFIKVFPVNDHSIRTFSAKKKIRH